MTQYPSLPFTEATFTVVLDQMPVFNGPHIPTAVRVHGKAVVILPKADQNHTVDVVTGFAVPKGDEGPQEALDYAVAASIADCGKAMLIEARRVLDEYHGAIDQQRTEREWGRI